jgi:hypothetical protein
MKKTMHVLEAACPSAFPELLYGRAGSTDHDLNLRTLMSEILHRCPKSRDQIADEMSAITGRRITKQMLDGYAAPSKEAARFPAAFAPAFCKATGDDRLLRLLLPPQLLTLIEIVEREISAAQQAHEAQALRGRLALQERTAL